MCAAHIASDFTCLYFAASGIIFGTTDVYELGFSYLSFSIFTVYNDDMLTEPIKKIPFLLYRDAHHNIRSPLKVNYAENAHTTLDHNESLITFRSRMHFPNTWRRMMMVGYLNACCKYTLIINVLSVSGCSKMIKA